MFNINKNDQFFLNLKNKSIHNIDDFLISTCNRTAFNLINNWPNWEYRRIIIIGEKGSGKSHLASIWQKKTKASVLNLKNFKKNSLDKIFLKNKHFIIDNISSIIQNANLKERADIEKHLLHFYNLIDEKKSYVIFTDIRPPKFWNLKLPDLKSRLMATFSVLIKKPDDEFLSFLLVKLFADKQILIDKKIIKFIVYRSERSFTSLQSLVNKIDKQSLITKKKININFVKKLI